MNKDAVLLIYCEFRQLHIYHRKQPNALSHRQSIASPPDASRHQQTLESDLSLNLCYTFTDCLLLHSTQLRQEIANKSDGSDCPFFVSGTISNHKTTGRQPRCWRSINIWSWFNGNEVKIVSMPVSWLQVSTPSLHSVRHMSHAPWFYCFSSHLEDLIHLAITSE